MPKKTPAQLQREINESLAHATKKVSRRPRGKPYSPIDDGTAAEIAAAWHSVMTWNDPGVSMYSVTSTGKIHSEKHRKQLLAYIKSIMPQAVKLDAEGEKGVATESNVADLEALRDWAKAFQVHRAHATVKAYDAPKPDLTVRQINAIVRAADGRNIYLIRTRLGDETIQRITSARTKGRETEVRSLMTGNWIPVLPERGDRLEVR